MIHSLLLFVAAMVTTIIMFIVGMIVVHTIIRLLTKVFGEERIGEIFDRL